ncbi:ergothioneine biosynthesis protein EgtB [Eisenibacter elegans]|jgi:ergothioneine biosynthesis protein EgtB|uniref:ergothioneine biosynthesis protein EgtB n=1 Tax=Eisenibacter elegans TaxID=997 RepID=UPI000409B1E0|nr:ergothioneine biosynthesis protein EgtB [Eisenibacter elegans]
MHTDQLISQYQAIRQHSLDLAAPLATEDFVAQPVIDVSPPKWHLAHTTWFFEAFLLCQYLPGYEVFHPRYAYLFNSYYDGMGSRVLRPQRGNMTRPTIDEIRHYRQHVDTHMPQLLAQLPEALIPVVQIGLQHEQQHQELLLTDLKYILGHNPLFPAYREDFEETPAVAQADSAWLEMPEGLYEIGHQGAGFAFDNELPRHKVFLQNYCIAQTLVTNAEYLAFVEDGGYKRYEFWHSDAKAWLQETDIQSPMYWHQLDGQWYRYALKGLEPLPLAAPVTHLSFYEAFAYAEWKGLRLPTEFEWEAAAPQLAQTGLRWEHTYSAYLPYPGYQKPQGALGEYNGKFMVNQMVLRGSSIATPPGHSRRSYRNFFHPHLQWQFNGLRLCQRQY